MLLFCCVIAITIAHANALKQNRNGGQPSKSSDTEDSALESFIDIINAVIAIVNLVTYIFAGGPEQIVVRLVGILVTVVLISVIAWCCGLQDYQPTTRAERNGIRAATAFLNARNTRENLKHLKNQRFC
jgi:xanthine/uracil permease